MAEDNRPLESLRHQYEVEKDLHGRLMNSTRAERTKLFAELYDELFRRVPDHPRLTRRDTEEYSRRAVAARMNILRPHLAGVKTFMEIAPGDCRLAYEMCQHVERVIALDISDQSGGQQNAPKNFHFETYDGYTLNLPDNSVDLAFSYQFLEHVHPDDHEDHFRTVLRVLRPGGAYIFDTPHKGVLITGDWQDLSHGVKIRFGSRTGHSKGSVWFVSYDGPEAYGIRIGHGRQKDYIENVRILGKGKRGARSLTREEAREALGMPALQKGGE